MNMYIKRLLDISKLILSFQILSDINEMLNRYRKTIESFSLGFKHSRRNVLVNIIIPTRNESKRLPILLKSLKLSYHKNFEIFVADYMSNDGTPEIARSFGANVIEVDKPGVGYASFLAVNMARGDIIIRTDADAIFPPHIIDYTIDVFEKYTIYYWCILVIYM